MANHVYCDISLVEGNKTSTKRFNEAFSSIVKMGETGLEYSSVLPEWDEEWVDREWMSQNVGPKWAYIEAMSEDEIDGYAHVVSAWSPPFEFMSKLASYCQEADADVKIKMTYVDEFYNFVGVWTFADGHDDNEESDGDTLFKARANELNIPVEEYSIIEDDEWHDYLEECLTEWASFSLYSEEDWHVDGPTNFV